MVSYFNPKKKTVIRNQPKKPGALLFFESSICGFFVVLLSGAFDPSGPPSGNASALPLDQLADVVQRGEMWISTIFHFMLHIIHVYPQSFTQSFQQSSINQPIMGSYDWCLTIFQDIQEVTVPLSLYCTLRPPTQPKRQISIPGFFELFNCRRMEWPGPCNGPLIIHLSRGYPP